MAFDAEKVKNDIVQWIRDWFEENGKGCKAVTGISGGKDSSVVAALCTEALGKENVFGVMMPNGEQFDIDVSKALVAHLGIDSVVFNIKEAYDGVVAELMRHFDTFSDQAKTNLPPRLRMAVLYAVSQNINGRVANTCNLSEDWVGYNTKFGDGAGDFSPLSKWTRCPSMVCSPRRMKTIWDSPTLFWTDTSEKASVKMKRFVRRSITSIRRICSSCSPCPHSRTNPKSYNL